MRFTEVTLAGPAGLPAFYRDVLGLPHDGDGIRIGETTLRFEPGDGKAFYHFALLVPGDRFDAAHAWAEQRVALRGGVFDSEDGDSEAIYFEDPARNIVELIAHHGLEENGQGGPFTIEELVGFSELGFVSDPPTLLRELETLGLELFRGTVDERNRLAFVGERGRTFILAPPGRGWLPDGRPAEPHPVMAVVEAPRQGRVELSDGPYAVTSGPSEQDAKTKAQRPAIPLPQTPRSGLDAAGIRGSLEEFLASRATRRL